MCLEDKDVLKKEKMLRNWTKWNEVASFLVNYFQHLFKVHHGCFWYWEIKVFSEITKKISIWYSKTQKRSQKSIRSIAVGLIFFSIWVFFHEHSRFTGQQGKGEGISLTPLYHFHPLHRHLDISWAITAVLYTYLFCYYTSVRRSP